MNLLMIICAALTGRITEWEHLTHYGGVSDVLVSGSTVMAATSGGVLLGTLQDGSVSWDSTWNSPGVLTVSDSRCLALDGSGNVWIGTYGGGIDVHLATGGFINYGQLEGLPINLEITCILPDTTVWAGTTQGLCSRELGYFNIWTQLSTGGGLPSDIINCIASVDSGLIVGTSSGIVLLRSGMYPGSQDSWIQFPSAESIGAVDLLVQGDTVWAAASTGLYLMVDGYNWSMHTPYPGGYPISLDLSGGLLAVGGLEDVCVFDGSSWERGTTGLQGQLVQDVAWIPGDSMVLGLVGEFSENRASGNGVAIGYLDSWQFSEPEGAPSNDLLSVTVDSRNDVWAGSNYRGAAVFSQGDWTRFSETLPYDKQIFACTADRSGGVFICPWHFGATWLDWQGTPDAGDDVYVFFHKDNSGLLNDQISSMDISPGGDIWFSQEPYWQTPTEPSGVCRLQWTPGDASSSSWRNFQPTNGLPSGFVRDVAVASSSTAWMGTEQGLVLGDIVTGQVLISAGTQEGLPSEDVKSLALSRTGILYVGTTAGLASFREEDDSFVEIEDVSGSVNFLVFDNLSCLWAGTTDALYRIYPGGTVEEYNTINSPLQSVDVRGAACDSDNGLLYLVTDHGMWMLSLEEGLSGTIDGAQVYPNPFLPGAGDVLGVAGLPEDPFDFRVFDLSGSLVYESLSQNRDLFAWDGTDRSGDTVASGTYMVRIDQNGSVRLVKLAVVR